MRTIDWSNAGLLILAIIFSIGLMFAFIELPRLFDSFLQDRLGFPQFDHGLGEINALKTEIFIRGLHLRWIGYASLLLILGMIIFGYATRKSGWAMAGAIGLFIPVFGQFALSMFFLAGLGFLRVGWLPFLEVSSFELLDLGRVIYVPYWILIWFFDLFNWNAHNFLSIFFMVTGALLFTWGVLVWFRARYNGQKVATSWIYKISRHPQYLGWIIWSYGIILFNPLAGAFKKTWSIPSSLPWLLMTMTIMGICMMEEIKMMKLSNGQYQDYRRSSPFLFPLPFWLKRILTWPGRLVTGGAYPSRGSQVVGITLLYTLILILLSLFWVDFRKNHPAVEISQVELVELSDLVEDIRSRGDDRRGIWTLVNKVPPYGQAGLDSLLVLARDKNPIVREFSMQVLGEQGLADLEPILLENLHDSIKRVRSAAILSAGQIHSAMAVDTLIQMVEHPRMPNNLSHIYSALGAIGDAKAIPCLAGGLRAGEWYNQIGALNAILAIDERAAAAYAVQELNDENTEVRRNAVMVCILSEDPLVIDPLKALSHDQDFEVRFYARQGVKEMEND